MQSIRLYLAKHLKNQHQQQLLTTSLVAAINRHTAVNLELSAVERRGRVIYIRAHPLIRSEIYLKREAILSDLENQTGQSARWMKIV